MACVLLTVVRRAMGQFAETPGGLPDVYFREIWVHLRWPVLGMAVFLAGWLWALASSVSIVAQARAAATKALPPRIGT